MSLGEVWIGVIFILTVKVCIVKKNVIHVYAVATENALIGWVVSFIYYLLKSACTLASALENSIPFFFLLVNGHEIQGEFKHKNEWKKGRDTVGCSFHFILTKLCCRETLCSHPELVKNAIYELRASTLQGCCQTYLLTSLKSLVWVSDTVNHLKLGYYVFVQYTILFYYLGYIYAIT